MNRARGDGRPAATSVRLDPGASFGALGVAEREPAIPPGPPAQLGSHTVLHLLGRGGMGEVYEAVDGRLLRRVAVKVLRPGSGTAAARQLVAEAQVTGQLEHPNIVPAHELGVDEHGRVFYTMKLVRGESLSQRIGGWGPEPLTAARIEEIVAIMRKLCDAMAFAHARGVVHRDLKPGNVMLGGYHEVLVVDWGLARLVGAEDLTRVSTRVLGPQVPGGTVCTLDGVVQGTPAYMAPEQARGENSSVGPASDIYSLGAILYHLLAGSEPVEGDTPQTVLEKVVAGALEPPQLRSPARRIPAELAAVAMKAMAHEPGERYPTAAAFEADLAAYIAGRAVSARSEAAWETLWRLARRHAAATAALLVVVAVGAAALALALDSRERALAGAVQARDAQIAAAAQAGRALAAERERGRAEVAASASIRRRVEALTPFTEANDLLLRGQLPERAAALLAQAVAIDPTFAEAHYALGQARLGCDEPMAAAEAFLAAARTASQAGAVHLPALLAAARTLDGCGDYARAEETYSRAVVADPGHPLSLVGRTLALFHHGHLADALAAAERAVQAGGHLWECHDAHGIALYQCVMHGVVDPGRIAGVVASLRRALELKPGQVEVRTLLIEALAAMGGEDARRDMELLRAVDTVRSSRSPQSRFQVAVLELEKGRGAEAQAMRGQLERDGAPVPLLAMFDARRAQRSGDAAGAVAALDRVLRASAPWPAVRLQHATALLAAGRRREGADGLARLVAEHPDCPPVHVVWVQEALRAGDHGEGERRARAGLAVAPFHPDLHLALLRSLGGQGKLDRAIESSAAAVELLPAQPRLWSARAEILAMAGRVMEADRAVAEFARRFPTYTADHARLRALVPDPSRIPAREQ